MPFLAPEEEIEKPPQDTGFTAPAKDLATPATGFVAPPEDAQAHVESLRDQSDFDPAMHAAETGDVDTAFKVHQARKARTVGEKAMAGAESLGGVITHPVEKLAMPVINFLSGFPQVALNTAQHAYYGLTGDDRAKTKQAEGTLALQHGEEAGKHMLDATVGNLAAGAAKLDDPDPARTAWRTDFIRRNPLHYTPDKIAAVQAQWATEDATERKARDEDIDRRVFEQRVQAARNQIQLAKGQPLDTGIISKIYEAGGQQPSSQVGPEALTAAGAPQADPGIVGRMAAATDPNNIALALAPGMPGAATLGGGATELAGKALQVPGRVISAIPGKLGKYSRGAASGAAAVEAAMNPAAAGTAAATVAGSKGLQMIGRTIEAQGKELRTGAPSQLTTKAATAAATGESVLGTNIARKVGDTVAHGAQTAAGMAPLNLALSEGDPKAFAELEAGAAAFGGTLNAFKRNRAMIVEGVRPHLRSEGARALAEASEGNDPLAAKSTAYLFSLPEAARDHALEAIGALQGLPLAAKGGPKRAKVYVLSEPDYLTEQARVMNGEQAAMGGGRGFFYGADGAAYVNGDFHAGLNPSELSHTIGHEFGGHAAINIMRAASDKGGTLYQGLMDSAKAGLLKPDGTANPILKRFIDQYNLAFDPSGQTQHVDPNSREAIDEFISETAGQIMAHRGAGELAVPRNVQDRIADGVGRFMGQMVGIDSREVGTPTKFGREEVGQLTQAVQDTLAQIVGMKLREGGEIPEPAKTGTTRAAELRQILSKPRPPMEGPLGVIVAWRNEQRSAQRELTELTEGQTAPFPAAGTPPQPPSRPATPTQPAPSPNSRSAIQTRVAAELRMRGVEASEAARLAAIAEGSNFDAMISDALQKANPQGPIQPSTAPANATPGSTTQAPPQPTPQGTVPVPAGTVAPATATTEVLRSSAPEVVARPVVGPATGPRKAPHTPQQVEALVRAAEAAATAKEKNTKTQAAKDRIRAAKVEAILDAIGTDDAGLHRMTDDLGNTKIAGDFDPENPLHRALVENLSGPDVERIGQLQQQKGAATYIRYRSAISSAEGEGGEGTMDTGMANRRAEYDVDPAQAREEGTIQHKVVIPIETSVSKNGGLVMRAFVPDNVLHNAESIFEGLKETGRPNPYGATPGKQGPLLIKDANAYAENHAHGYKGDGSGPIKQFPDSGLPTPDPNYTPTVIPKARFDILNMAMHNETAGKNAERLAEVQEKRQKIAEAKTDKDRMRLQGVLERSIARQRQSEESKNLGEFNDRWVDRASGETNQLRSELKAAGFDTGERFKSPFENLLPRHILEVSDAPIKLQEGDIPSVRPTGMDVDPREIVRSGRPNDKAVAAGFMPSEKETTMYVASRGKHEGLPPIPFYVASTSDYAKNFGGNVKEVKIAPKNTLDLSHIDPRSDDGAMALKEALESNGILTKDLSIFSDDEAPQAIMRNVKEIGNRAKLAGFDSLKINEYVDGGGEDTTMLIVSDSALGKQPSERSSFMPTETMRDDMTTQAGWLKQEARSRGYQSTDELLEKEPSEFTKLSARWRTLHPRDEKGFLSQNDAARSINSVLYGDKNSDSVRPIAGTREAFRDAAENIGGGEQTSRPPEEQATALRAYAKEKGIAFSKLPRRFQPGSENDKGGMEHHVWFDDKSGRWLKATVGSGAGMGMRPFVTNDGGWALERGTVKDYLKSRDLWNQVFGDDIRFHGVWDDGRNVSVVTSQPDISGEPITAHQIMTAMESAGFKAMGDSVFYRPWDDVAVFDLHAGNAVNSGGSMIPFDGIILHPSEDLLDILKFDKATGKSRMPVDEAAPKKDFMEAARNRLELAR